MHHIYESTLGFRVLHMTDVFYFEYVLVYILELACVRDTLIFDTCYDAYICIYMMVVMFYSNVIVFCRSKV